MRFNEKLVAWSVKVFRVLKFLKVGLPCSFSSTRLDMIARTLTNRYCPKTAVARAVEIKAWRVNIAHIQALFTPK